MVAETLSKCGMKRFSGGSMKPFLSIFFIVAVVFTLGGCSNGSTQEAAANSVKPEQPVSEAPKTPSVPAVFEIPAGTSLRVTLIDGVSSRKNKSGEMFLDRKSTRLNSSHSQISY